MRIRNVLQELETKLEPSSASLCPTARGKAEWKVYGDGTRQCKVVLSRLELPEGAVLELAVDSRQLTQLIVQNGAARYRRESARGEDVPTVELNQLLQVIYNGQVILEGLFYAE